LSNRVKVVVEPTTALMYMPLVSVFFTASPVMFRVGVAVAVEPTWNE
jgi:hypothetical protein